MARGEYVAGDEPTQSIEDPEVKEFNRFVIFPLIIIFSIDFRITMLNATVSYDSHDIISFPPAQPQDRDNFNMLKVKVSFH